MKYAIIDIETTGGTPKSSKITEIAIYIHDGTEVIDEYETLINPEIPIPPFITNLTGISDHMVSTAPKFFEVAKTIVEFTKDCIFVAHNVGFDYGIVRIEFKALGFDYRRPHLCTVRASRYVIPGHDSYSLGKLTRALGIELSGRHRAGGDALATAKLFTLLMETDSKQLSTFIQEEVNPKRLHPNLDLEVLEDIPNKPGVYRFFNDTNELIYIGKSIHILKRIEQHLRNATTQKSIQMQKEISRIEYDLTGSELIALLQESLLIKEHQPIYNRALKRHKFPYGLYDYVDEKGYLRLMISSVAKMNESPLLSYNSKREATASLERLVEEHQLCKKLCNIYKTSSACFQYTIKECKGACVNEESTEDYNARCQGLVDELNLNEATFYIVDKGRQRNEKSLIYVEKGTLRGIGYAPFHFNRKKPKNWDSFIDFVPEDRDARTILKLFLRKNEGHELVHI